MSDEDKDKVMKAIQEAYWEAKEINKKYTRKHTEKTNLIFHCPYNGTHIMIY